jgi:large subunit ribosomal protein L25
VANKPSDTLAILSRSQHGTTSARALRRSGRIPAVLFGHGQPTIAVSVAGRAFEELLHSGHRHHLLTITVDGGAKDTALVRDIQRDPITRRVIHADIQRVGRSESITTVVPVTVVGAARGVRDLGGVLDVVSHQLEITGPADQIPEHVEVDVTNLGMREHLTAGEIALPKGFTLASAADMIVASVEPPRVEAVEEAPVEAETPAGEVPTVGESEAGSES